MPQILFDYSTLDLEAIQACPTLWEWQQEQSRRLGYRVSQHAGSACFLDAPGFPSYFVHSAASLSHSDTTDPLVIPVPQWQMGENISGKSLYVVSRQYPRDLFPFWIPLPEDHPRVVLWIMHSYAYFKHCYGNPFGERDVHHCLVWPIPDYSLPVRFRDHEGYREEYREQQRALVAEQNRLYIESFRDLAVSENHLAVLHIRTFYPDHQPILEWIEEPPIPPDQQKGTEHWWERFDRDYWGLTRE